jgi:hypothetical protein
VQKEKMGCQEEMEEMASLEEMVYLVQQVVMAQWGSLVHQASLELKDMAYLESKVQWGHPVLKGTRVIEDFLVRRGRKETCTQIQNYCFLPNVKFTTTVCCLTVGEKFHQVAEVEADTVIASQGDFSQAGINSMPALEEECLRHVHQQSNVELLLQDG